MNKEEIYSFLTAQGVPFEKTEHGAVYNMEQLAALKLPYPDREGKNLFLRDEKREQYVLLTVRGDKQVDLTAFRKANGLKARSFASPEELMALLGLEPGGVTPLGLLNDAARRVRFYLDRELMEGVIGVHPNENTATVWVQAEDLVRLVRDHGNEVHVVEIPERKEAHL